MKEAITLLLQEGKAVVTPTKVGYIIATTDRAGLERKFALKGRPRSKPGVVLCSSVAQVAELAEMSKEIRHLYESCFNKDLLLGCILPWKPKAIERYVPKDGTQELIMDKRHTSCFVIRFGKPSEAMCQELWDHHRLIFASSANPSGKGNRGKLEGVGEQILTGVDLAMEDDAYVASQQPGATAGTRYEQGVMVSMVDADGRLTDNPTVIRKGLAVEQLMLELAMIWNRFDYRHGAYH